VRAVAGLKQGIMVGTEVHGNAGLPPDGAVKHSAKCRAIDDAGMDAEADDATGEWIHEDEDPMGARVADSHLNRSILQRLSFMCPRKVSQDGPAEWWFRDVSGGHPIGYCRQPASADLSLLKTPSAAGQGAAKRRAGLLDNHLLLDGLLL